MPQTIVGRVVDLNDDAVARSVTDDGEVFRSMHGHAASHRVSQRLCRLTQVRIEEVFEFSLSRKEGRCCGGKPRRKQSGQKRE